LHLGYIFKYEKVDNDWNLSVLSGRDTEHPQCIDNVVIRCLGKEVTMNEETYAHTLRLKCPLGTKIEVEFFYKTGFEVQSSIVNIIMDKDMEQFQYFMEKNVTYH